MYCSSLTEKYLTSTILPAIVLRIFQSMFRMHIVDIQYVTFLMNLEHSNLLKVKSSEQSLSCFYQLLPPLDTDYLSNHLND